MRRILIFSGGFCIRFFFIRIKCECECEILHLSVKGFAFAMLSFASKHLAFAFKFFAFSLLMRMRNSVRMRECKPFLPSSGHSEHGSRWVCFSLASLIVYSMLNCQLRDSNSENIILIFQKIWSIAMEP